MPSIPYQVLLCTLKLILFDAASKCNFPFFGFFITQVTQYWHLIFYFLAKIKFEYTAFCYVLCRVLLCDSYIVKPL